MMSIAKKINRSLSISGFFTKDEENDIIEVLKKSLENGKDFYPNAKPYMKKNMEELIEFLEKVGKFNKS